MLGIRLLHSPSPREEALVQLIHTFICSHVRLLAADDGDIHYIWRIVVDEYRLRSRVIVVGMRLLVRRAAGEASRLCRSWDP